MSKRVLLVDDDVDFRISTGMQLQAAGYEVVPVEGVAAARAWLAEHRPDAAILDLMMEEADGGFQLCFHIKRLDPAIPVIMVSSVTRETGLSFGATSPEQRSWLKADAFLAKPLRFEQLQRELDRLTA